MTTSNQNFLILIVDDNLQNRELLIAILSEEGYKTHTAQNGREALAEAHATLPDLILLDVLMPDMDGFEACQALKTSRDTANIPIIFLTALADTENIITGFKKGGVDYLTKPFNAAELLARVHTHLELKSKEAEIQKLSLAVEQSPISVVITDLDGCIEYVNPKFTSLTGYSFDEVLGKNPRILSSGETSLEEYKNLWETITSGHVWKGVLHNKKKNGELYWESASIAPIKNDKGTLSHFIAVKEDITAQKISTEKLQESYRTIKAQKEQLTEELEQARVTQQSLLPLSFPKIPHAKVAAKYLPMEEVGGDFYDVFELESNIFGLLIADVTGHGVSAALLSFMFYSMFTNACHSGNSPALTVKLTNEYLAGKVEEGKFATMFYAVYNASTRQLTYTGAGHPSGYLIRPSENEIIELDTEGMLIGFFSGENARFEEKIIQLYPGDKVFLYTDGIIEVLNSHDEILGSDRLKSLLLEHKNSPIEDLLDTLYEFGNKFSEFNGFDDDITMLGLEVT